MTATENDPQVEISEKIKNEDYVEAIELLQEHGYDEFLRSVWQMPDKPRDLPQDVSFVWQLDDDKWHMMHRVLHTKQQVDEINARRGGLVMVLFFFFVLAFSILSADSVILAMQTSIWMFLTFFVLLPLFAIVFISLSYYSVLSIFQLRQRRRFYSGETKKSS